jgi:tRNA-specific 2-thiouridylase
VVCAERETRSEKRESGSAQDSLLAPRSLPLYHKQGCCTASDADDARRVADKLGLPFYALNLQQEFGQIIDYFVAEYSAGRTPNPCVQCNNWIKFGKLFDYADSVGAEFVATGHYARLGEPAGEPAVAGGPLVPKLLRGIDGDKDQSYVLFGIRRELLSRMMLPVGHFEKPVIRQMAAAIGLRVADKKDSQEICFVTRGRYDEFVRCRARADNSGELVTTDGTVVGEHHGIESFTVGQRKGLGVALGDRKFVVRIEPDSRRVVIGDRDDLNRQHLTARDCNWLVSNLASNQPMRCYAQIRYNADAHPATMTLLPEQRLHILFDEPQFAVTPGQAIVCYDAENNERVLGGGWIE